MASTSFYPVSFVAETYPQHVQPRNETRHMFSNALGDIYSPESVTHVPRVNTRKTKEQYFLDIEVPGLSSVKNLDVQWTRARAILIRGDIFKRVNTAGSAASNRSEKNVGSIVRAYEFKADVDQDSLKFDLKNGLLTVTVNRTKAKGKGKST
jgi:HSP20 family molecular chaperone IbpA